MADHKSRGSDEESCITCHNGKGRGRSCPPFARGSSDLSVICFPLLDLARTWLAYFKVLLDWTGQPRVCSSRYQVLISTFIHTLPASTSQLRLPRYLLKVQELGFRFLAQKMAAGTQCSSRAMATGTRRAWVSEHITAQHTQHTQSTHKTISCRSREALITLLTSPRYATIEPGHSPSRRET